MVHNKSEHFCKLDVGELSPAARKALAEVYAEDMALFGYSPDAPHALPQKGAFKMNKVQAARGSRLRCCVPLLATSLLRLNCPGPLAA